MRKLSIILYFVLFSLITNAQRIFHYEYDKLDDAEYLVTYKHEFKPDSTNNELVRNSEMLLFIGKNISKFISQPAYVIDTNMRRIPTDEMFIEYFNNPTTPIVRVSYEIYKNHPTGKLSYIQHIPSETYKYEEPLGSFTWKLSNETKTYMDYNVQKATCSYGGREWIAWFCPELNFNDGPYKFHGLPGLIVQIYDTRHHYNFDLSSINKLEPSIAIDITRKEYVNTTKSGLHKAEDNFRDDIINRAKSAGLSNSSQQAAAKSLSIKNNPLELLRK